MKAAAYVRVSSETQTTDNQLPAIKALAEARGWQLVREYSEQASAYVTGRQVEWKRCVRDAEHHHFDIIITWSLDRVSREGALRVLSIVEHLKRRGIRLVSVQEPWADTTNDFNDVLFAIMGWIANQESKRRSERTKAGIAFKRQHGGGKRGRDKRRRVRRWLKRPQLIEAN